MARLLVREQIVPRPLDEVFDFFAKAENLETMTPSWLNFHILTPPPIEMREGQLIDYRIRLLGVPMTWRTRIDEWVPNVRFVDTQLKGPYALWRHLHAFEEVPGGVRMRDEVQYELPLGPLGAVAHALFVEAQLRAIFDHRRKTVEARFGRATT